MVILAGLNILGEFGTKDKNIETAAPKNLSSTLTKPTLVWYKSGPVIVMFGLCLGYIVGIMGLHILNFQAFRYGFDLSFYEQAVWNTVHGRFLQVSATDFSSSLLGTDAILILALMSPFYAIVPSPFTLLFLETLVVATGVWPLFWLARERLKNEWAAVMMAATYLFLLAVQNANLYEWRERPMAMGFWLWTFYFYQRGRFKTFIFWAVLVLCCRPENGLVLVMLALYGWLQGYPKRPAFGWKFVWGPLLLGLLWFGVVVVWIIPFNTNGQSFALAANYGDLGQSPSEILKNLIANPLHSLSVIFPSSSITLSKLVYIPLLLLPFVFLPLVSPTVLLMTLPPLALNILSIRSTQYNPYNYHYQGSIVPWLLFATIFSLEKLLSRNLHLPLKNIGLTLSGLVLAVTLLIYLVSDINPIKHALGRSARPDVANAQALLQEIPSDAPLAISSLWADRVPMRTQLYLLQVEKLYSLHPTDHAQYVFIDKHTIGGEAAPANVQLINGLLNSPDWQILAAKGAYVLLKRK